MIKRIWKLMQHLRLWLRKIVSPREYYYVDAKNNLCFDEMNLMPTNRSNLHSAQDELWHRLIILRNLS